ncbi:MAG: hypothetical protein KGQ49_02980 [Verrucomicrobia bacterium]|nr:hypothetical protein [Verrucomicrobiota bacterium]MBU6446346.1 hypothetical protein [Verrucomicrobiota bacterium]MDE3047038.1 hypothetical protein [Verrucomicrobiota bacterium]
MKRLLHRFSLFSRSRQIAVAVALVHVAIVLSLMGHHLFTRRWRTPRPMIVKTIVPMTAPVAVKTVAPSPAKSSGAQSSGVKPSASQSSGAQPSASPPSIAKPSAPQSGGAKPSPKPAAVAKAPVGKIVAASKEKGRNVPKVEPNVLQEIADSFDSMRSEPVYSSRSALHVPVKPSAKIEEAEPVADATYEEVLIALLQNTLDLPEFGDVKMEIEIDAYGKVVASKILESKSLKNAKFLQEELTTLSFPIPFDMKKGRSFTVVFRNK